MLAILVIAASLAAQAWIFRDTPGHPADPCARSADHCPEEGLDSLFARQAALLERQRAKARGEDFPAAEASTAAAGSGLSAPRAPRAPQDSLQDEVCRLPGSDH